jgi:DNA ligase-1
MFKEFQLMITDLGNTSSSNLKKEILKRHCDANTTNKELLKACLRDIIKYNVTPENCIKNSGLTNPVYIKDIFELLNMLSERKLSGYDAIGAVNSFINNNIEFKDIIFKILDKDLKCGVNSSIVNKVYPKLIPEFKVALANSYKDYSEKFDFFNGEWGTNKKIDGLRCIAVIKAGTPTFYTRKGREFTTLKVLSDSILSYNIEDCVLDGELCIVDENGAENFKEISKVYKKKDFTIPNPKYIVFDVITIEEFFSQKGNTPIMKRIERIPELGLSELFDNSKNFSLLTQNIINSKEDLEQWTEKASKNNWEGLMLRNLKVGYEGKRTKNLLKVKKFSDAEFVVTSIETGPYSIVKDGKNVVIETMTSVVTEYKGNKLSVGSGCSLDQRNRFYNNPNEIIGETITVKYFEETEDKNGKKSLRFPTVKHIFEGARDN